MTASSSYAQRKQRSAPRVVEYRPQPGPQEMFLSSPADIVIYGGMAGGGKTWGLEFEPLRHILPSARWPNGVPGFTGVIFRRTAPQIRNEGGLWDESLTIYPHFGGKPIEHITEWRFQGGQTIRFASMQHEKDRFDWDGSQIPYIGFDELIHFTEEQFFYLLSRNRTTIGIKPYVRATTNPDADSWVADFIAWWINQDEQDPNYGLPIPERIGKIRYFVRKNDQLHWGDTPEELYHLFEHYPAHINRRNLVKSLTFIPASVYDNRKLLDANPEYLANLEALPYVERMRLLGGNWKIRPTTGNIFNRSWWIGKIVAASPAEGRRVRYWDKAATDKEERGATEHRTPYTVGLLLNRTSSGLWYVEDVRREQVSPGKRELLIQETALDDGPDVVIWIEQEPGSGGKESAQISIKGLAGYNVRKQPAIGNQIDSKIGRAMPASAQVEAGNVYLVEAPWNKAFIDELHAFPQGRLKDQVDAFSGAFNKLARRKRGQKFNRQTR